MSSALSELAETFAKANTMDGTNVQWVQPRSPDGKFVSHVNDLRIYRHKASRSGPASQLGHYTKTSKGLEFGQTGKVGRRLK